nr:hypothetical protein [Mucilaginibacter sp. X5P1]
MYPNNEQLKLPYFSLFNMKNASNIFTSILILPIVALLYTEYDYLKGDSMAKELMFVLEMKVLTQIIACLLLFGYSFFLTKRKKYYENTVLFVCFIVFIIADVILNHYGQNRAHFRHP